MKNLFWVVCLAASLLCGFVYYKTGRVPVREWSEHFITPFTASFTAPSTTESTAVKIYKWTDANGVVHYDNQVGNQPVKNAQTLNIDPNKNVLPMEKMQGVSPTEKPPVDDAKQAVENIEKMRRAMEKKAGI
jgi:hypothetical protein